MFVTISGHKCGLFGCPVVVDLDWMLSAYQSHPVTPLLNWTREGKHNERLEGQDKGREINDQLQSWASQTKFREKNSFITNQITVG